MKFDKKWAIVGLLVLLGALIYLGSQPAPTPPAQQAPAPATPVPTGQITANDIFKIEYSPTAPLEVSDTTLGILVANVWYNNSSLKFVDSSGNHVDTLTTNITFSLKKAATSTVSLPVYVVVNEAAGRSASGDEKPLVAKKESDETYMVSFYDSDGNPLPLNWDAKNKEIGQALVYFKKDEPTTTVKLVIDLDDANGAGFKTSHLYKDRTVLTLYYGGLDSPLKGYVKIRLTNIVSAPSSPPT